MAAPSNAAQEWCSNLPTSPSSGRPLSAGPARTRSTSILRPNWLLPGGSSPAMKKVEHYSVQKVTGDGRCMFRELVKGMALNKGIVLRPHEETGDADDLRMAVNEDLCDSEKERIQHEEALIAITVEESLKRYCQCINHSDFWGGESELLHSSSTWG